MYGSKNPNWKGGISYIRKAEDIFSVSDEIKIEIRRRLLNLIIVDENTGCWNWTGNVFIKTGYARISFLKTPELASRVAFVIFKKKRIGKLRVLHTCDNRLCINPKHLWLGTNADNSKDMVNKKRQAYGERNSGAKLTAKQVLEIRKRVGTKSLYGLRANLAKEFGVCKEAITLIVNRRLWKSI